MPAEQVAPPLARRVNISNVFSQFWDADVLTVSDLMASTGLTRATVHAVCNDLVRLGWVRPLAAQRSDGAQAGRPAKRFAFNHRAGHVLGIDVGDTSINAVLADLRGTTLATRHQAGLATQMSPLERVEHVGRLVKEMFNESGVPPDQVLAAGVGVAAPVSEEGRSIGYQRGVANPYWQSFRIDSTSLGHEIGGVPVLLANDANLAAIGEHWRGAAQGVDTFVALLAGKRLGAGLMDSGRLLYGHDGGAGEMSFLDHVLDEGGADGMATLATRWAAKAMAKRRRSSLQRMCGADVDSITAEVVFKAAAEGDAVSQDVLDRLADRFARIIAIVSIFLNPELVVIGGGVAQSATSLAEQISERLEGLMAIPPPKVVCSTFGEAIVTVGALRLALNHVHDHALDDLRSA